jgi:hypothetical protein
MEYKLNETGDILFEFLTDVISEKSQSISVPVNEGTYGIITSGRKNLNSHNLNQLTTQITMMLYI